jgi:hypothetical protein
MLRYSGKTPAGEGADGASFYPTLIFPTRALKMAGPEGVATANMT